jgi:hypothetical protein
MEGINKGTVEKMEKEIEIKETTEVDFILRSLGCYLKVPQEVKAKFGVDLETASPKVNATQDKGKLILAYAFDLDKEGKARKQGKN